MKKYTTLLCLLLALVMVMTCFTGCAKQPAQSDPADTTEPAQTTDTTPEDSTPAEPADTRETVNIRFAQFGNNLDDLDGYANDPIKAAIEQAVGVTLEYDTGTDGFDDRMQTELFTGSAPDLFPTWGESDKIASWVQDGLVTNLGEIVNADPDRYPTLYKMMNSEEWKAYNKLYTGDETASYAIYSVAAFADPSFGGVPVYNQAILDEVNEGKVPATVDEFLTYCEAAGSAGYVGWWPRNDKLTNWNEIDATLALPQGTSITVPKGAGTGTILSGEAGTDSEYWTVSAVSEQSKAVVKQLAELYKNGGLDANIGVKGDFDDAYADFGNGTLGAVNFGFGYPGQFRDFFKSAWLAVHPDASIDDLAVGIEHRHAIRSHVPHVGPYLCSIPAERYETILTVTVRIDTRLGEEIVHLVLVFQSVDHSLRQRIFGLDRRQLVGVFVEHLDRQAARLGHVARNDAPHRVHQLPQLFPIGIGQLREDVGFHSTLVLAGRRTEYLDFEIELVEQPLEK